MADFIFKSIVIFFTLLFYYSIFLFFRFIYRSFKKAKHQKGKETSVVIEEREKWPYYTKNYLLSSSERKFYNVLKNAVGNEFEIFSKVRLADILEIPSHLKYIKTFWYKIQSKHVDYLLCDKEHYSPKLVIELDGAYHDLVSAEKNDNFKNEAFEDAKISFLRVKRMNNYDQDEVRKVILEMVGDSLIGDKKN